MVEDEDGPEGRPFQQWSSPDSGEGAYSLSVFLILELQLIYNVVLVLLRTVNQPYVYIYALPPEPAPTPPLILPL